MDCIFTDRTKHITLFLLRVVAGLLFLQAGGMKIFDWFGGSPPSSAVIRLFSHRSGLAGCWSFTAARRFCWASLPGLFPLSCRERWRWPTFSFINQMAFGLSKTTEKRRYCSALFFSFWRRMAGDYGASTRGGAGAGVGKINASSKKEICGFDRGGLA